MPHRHNPKTAFVPLSGTFYEAYAIHPYPDGQKNRNRRRRAMPIFYPSDHPSPIVRPEERHRSPSARKDELQGRARKSECPKRSVATQVFRISASAARLSAWETVALTFFCLLFLCQDKKRRWGPVGASPHPMADEGQDPNDLNKSPIDATQKPHSSPFRGRPMGRMLLRPTHSDENNRPSG